MPAKVVIIDIDLGLSIDDIIAAEVEDLTGASKRELDNALETAKITHKVKEERETAATEAAKKLSNAMETAYANLLAAGDIGLPVSTVMADVAGIVPNSSAFTTRMKSLLSSKGNPQIIERKKVHGTPHYVLLPFNQQPTAP